MVQCLRCPAPVRAVFYSVLFCPDHDCIWPQPAAPASNSTNPCRCRAEQCPKREPFSFLLACSQPQLETASHEPHTPSAIRTPPHFLTSRRVSAPAYPLMSSYVQLCHRLLRKVCFVLSLVFAASSEPARKSSPKSVPPKERQNTVLTHV